MVRASEWMTARVRAAGVRAAGALPLFMRVPPVDEKNLCSSRKCTIGGGQAQGRVDVESSRAAWACLSMGEIHILRIAPRLRPSLPACYAAMWRRDAPSHAGP